MCLASCHVAAANNATVHCEAVAAAPPTTALQPVYTLGYTLLPASCCEFHFRCDILLQNFIFNLCTYYTACHAQHSTPLFGISLSLSVYVCPTYLAFVFIFSVIVLFLPCHGNCFLSLPPHSLSRSPSLPATACVHATYHLWIRSVHSLGRLMLLIIITSIMTGFL